jgi:acetoin utilization protein AcuB
MMPAISRYMTKQPWTIARSRSLGEAHALMREHQLRHLPVLDRGQLVGVVSLGDLHLLEVIDRIASDDIPVADAMTEHPFVVTSDAPLDEVAEIMAEKRYGSAIIMGRDGVEGIFTTVDACRALASVLQRIQLDEIAATD